ncbi:MAG TPA: YihY/virulence factor BrkB family protein [Gemmatimonadaceae bacterium]|nr:YihY/virulence factor BrkB family protein [Gemmatimonadaceae bacterium]
MDVLGGTWRKVTRRTRGAFATFGGLLRDAWIEYERDRANYLAKAIIYYAGVSLIPLLLLAVSTVGLLLRFTAMAAELEHRMLNVLSARFGSELAETVYRLFAALQRDSIAATIISVLGVLVSASLLLRQLRMTFRAVWHYEPPLVAGTMRVRALTMVREWVIAALITAGGGGLLIAAFIVLAAFRAAARLLDRVPLLRETGPLLAVVSSFVLAAMTFGALLKVLPPRPVRWRDIWPSVVLCAAMWIFASELLPLYNRIVGNESTTAYSAIGALLPLALTATLAGTMLFFGAELSKVTTLRHAATPHEKSDARNILRKPSSPDVAKDARHLTAKTEKGPRLAPRNRPRGVDHCRGEVES